jgi:transposase
VKRKVTGRITKTGRVDLRSALITAAHAAKRLNPHWRAEFQRLAKRIGRHKATVAVARKLLVSIWHLLTRREVDRYMVPAALATTFASFVYGELGGTDDLPGGRTALEFVRHLLDQLQVGKELQYVMLGRKRFILPKSSQPGAAPVPEPEGRGQRQNTRAAKEARAAEAARKRAKVEAKRAEAEARLGRPRKVRADKGIQRGPNKLTKEKAAQAVR